MIDTLLHEEHVATLDLINELEVRLGTGKWNSRLVPSVPADKAQLEKLLALMDSEVRHHLPIEEGELFPRLDELGFEDITAMLFAEHEEIRALINSLRLLTLEALDKDFGTESWKQFCSQLSDLAGLIIFHIQKEEMGVISRLRMLLGAEACQEMATTYRARQA